MSSYAIATDFNASTTRMPISISNVLFAGTSPAGTTYVADPGMYTLRLDGSASDGSCTGTPTFWYPWMTYVLLGTSS